MRLDSHDTAAARQAHPREVEVRVLEIDRGRGATAVDRGVVRAGADDREYAALNRDRVETARAHEDRVAVRRGVDGILQIRKRGHSVVTHSPVRHVGVRIGVGVGVGVGIGVRVSIGVGVGVGEPPDWTPVETPELVIRGGSDADAIFGLFSERPQWQGYTPRAEKGPPAAVIEIRYKTLLDSTSADFARRKLQQERPDARIEVLRDPTVAARIEITTAG